MGDELDERLDRGLRSYSAAEPLVGLEERVVARARGPKLRRQGLVWGWAGGLAVMGCLALVLSLHQEHAGGTAFSTKAVISARTGGSAGTVVALVKNVGGKKRGRGRVRKPSVPIAPMTEEEALLVRFLAADPEGSVKVLASLSEASKPLVVEPIRIESLELKKEGDDETDLPVDHGSGR